jgi:uncharacterized delta-60 repeat protein
VLGPTRAFRVLVFALAIAAFAASAPSALAAAGELDPSWGGTGVVTTPFPAADSFGDGVIARGNEVVVAGAACAAGCDFALARYNRDGSLDPTFGTAGEVTKNITLDDQATSLAYQGDKIVVAGFTAPDGINDDFAVARFNKDGSPDLSFGTGGAVTTDFGGDDIADAVVIKGDQIIVAGATTAGGGSGYNFALARYNKNGALDQSFGTAGRVITDFNGGYDAANGVQVMDDRIVAVGYVCKMPNGSASGCYATGQFDFGLARYNRNGTLDPTFGAGGKVETDFNGGSDLAHAVDIRGETIAAIGEASNGNDGDFAVAEYDRSGNLQPRFGGDGKSTLDMGGNDSATGGAIQYDWRVVMAGATPDGPFGDVFAVGRFTGDGNPDSSFGGGTGFTTTPIGPFSAAQALAVGPDNRILAAGYTCDATCDFAVARYLAN